MLVFRHEWINPKQDRHHPKNWKNKNKTKKQNMVYWKINTMGIVVETGDI